MLVPTLAACNKDKNKEDKDKTIASEEASTDLADAALPGFNENWAGKEFNIIYRETYGYEWEYSEEETGNAINDAIFKRNSAVEARYGILLVNRPVANSSFENDF